MELTAIQKRILIFFQEHPQAVETVRGMATWLSVEPEKIQEALNDLIERRWLQVHQASAVTGYTLTHDERILIQMRQSLEAP